MGKAAQEAGKGNGTGALEKLASAGQWALKIATEIGVKVAAEAISRAMGAK